MRRRERKSPESYCTCGYGHTITVNAATPDERKFWDECAKRASFQRKRVERFLLRQLRGKV